jgi:hypothetical protein
MVTSKTRWTTTATKLVLTTAMSVFWMATTPAAAAADPVSAARAATLRDCSWMSHDDWAYAYRACMAQHGQQG